MNFVVFGATGGTGRELLKQGLAAGHSVRAFARNQSTLDSFKSSVGRLEVVSGDVYSAGDVRAAVAGQEAVLSALGARSLGKSDLLERSMANILAAMRDEHVRRLIVLGASGALREAGKNLSFSQRLIFGIFKATLLKQPFIAQTAMQRMVEASDRNWTIVLPPRLLNEPGPGKYRVEADGLPALGTQIPRADVADFMLRQLSSTEWVRRSPYIAR